MFWEVSFSLRLLLVKIIWSLQKLPIYSVLRQMSPLHNSPEWFMTLNACRLPLVTTFSPPPSQYSKIAGAANLSFLPTCFNKISFILVLGIYLGDMTRWHRGTVTWLKIFFFNFQTPFFYIFNWDTCKILFFLKLFADKFDIQVTVHRDKFL